MGKFDLRFCLRCSKKPFLVRVSEDIGFCAHWDGKYYLVDVVLFLNGVPSFVLFREVWVLDG